jgi:uncharacterized membrane protein YsdA (DUF1294 family)
MKWKNPVFRYALITFGLSLVGAVLIALNGVDPVLAWLLVISLVTFLTYGYDKLIAGSGRMRVPERVLLALAFAGGTLGALVGMWLFRHKTAKASFRLKFWLVVAAQIAVLVVYFAFIRPQLVGG